MSDDFAGVDTKSTFRLNKREGDRIVETVDFGDGIPATITKFSPDGRVLCQEVVNKPYPIDPEAYHNEG
jgi:hypothetical protein